MTSLIPCVRRGRFITIIETRLDATLEDVSQSKRPVAQGVQPQAQGCGDVAAFLDALGAGTRRVVIENQACARRTERAQALLQRCMQRFAGSAVVGLVLKKLRIARGSFASDETRAGFSHEHSRDAKGEERDALDSGSFVDAARKAIECFIRE